MCGLGAFTSRMFAVIGPYLATRCICRFNPACPLTEERRGRSGASMHNAVSDLTADAFRTIIDAPPAAAGSERREQRRTPRTRTTVRAALMPFSDRFALETIVAPIRDISRGG